MNRIIASFALAVAFVASALPAFAKDFVQDNAGLFSANAISQLNTRITNFNAQTGKEIVVVTVPSSPNADAVAAAENTFAQQSVNGVLIYVDKGDRQSRIIPDRAGSQAGWFTPSTLQSIVNAMNAQFKAGNFDTGITGAVNSIFDVYRSHLGSLHSGAPAATRTYAQQSQAGGVHISVFWWIIIALFAFFIIRSLMRAARGGYYGGYGPGYGPGAGPGGYGGPGYGPGYGYGGWGGGGGGFWSGLLGGLGGAFLGNELFGRGGGFGGTQAGIDPGVQNAAPVDGGGWQSDPGQADMGGSAGGGWGDSGGGFGGGDFGGGGGGFGGGDGGAGGGW